MEYNVPPKINKKRYSTVSSMLLYKNLPFLFVLCLLGLFYIANVHYAEKNMKKSQQLMNEVKEIKWDYWTMKSGILYQSTEGQISKKVSEQNIEIRKEAPLKLIQKQN
ncbi:MAG TPA: FtsL-like putative cell division protein [Saprospiraceae bacterium]|nr:FtsL-like putative cell division protein [Saprospiraceae bacterium]